MTVSLKRIAAFTVGILFVGGCGQLVGPAAEDPFPPRSKQERISYGERGFEGRNSVKEFILGSGNGADENGLPVNKYLWRASINVLSASLPLASTDPFSGVIATDWGAAANTNERVRVTATVQGTELTARGLNVQVFRETLNPAGAWISAPVSPQTSSKLKDSILVRAREIRIQAVDGTVL